MAMGWRVASGLLGLWLCGCAVDEGPALTLAPDHATLFGHVDVEIRGALSSLGEVRAVTIGGVHGYALRQDGELLTVRLQGSAEAGAADVVLEGTLGRAVRHGAFRYDAPAGVPSVWVAFGASLTQGVQSGGIDRHSQLQSPAALLARQAGVFLGVPLIADGLVPPLQPGDFPSGCSPREGAGAGLFSVTDTLTDPTTGELDLRRGRIDWTLPVQNHAIGRSKVQHILHGLSGGPVVMAHIVEDPTMDPTNLLIDELTSQIDRIEALDPDVGICTDLLANDLDPAVAEDDDIHGELNTDLTTVRPLLAEMMARLGKLHGQFFFSNMPAPTLIPKVAVVRAQRLAAGTDSAESFAAKLLPIEAQTVAYNAALAEAVAPYPNLHVVDFAAAVQGKYTAGLDVGGEHLTLAPFGGLFSLDHLHFSDTGYAVFANELLPAINAALGASIPPVDLVTTHAGDALAPSRLRDLGLHCEVE